MEKKNDFFILHPCLIMEKEEEKKKWNFYLNVCWKYHSFVVSGNDRLILGRIRQQGVPAADRILVDQIEKLEAVFIHNGGSAVAELSPLGKNLIEKKKKREKKKTLWRSRNEEFLNGIVCINLELVIAVLRQVLVP